jgi:hypothetical protein
VPVIFNFKQFKNSKLSEKELEKKRRSVEENSRVLFASPPKCQKLKNLASFMYPARKLKIDHLKLSFSELKSSSKGSRKSSAFHSKRELSMSIKNNKSKKTQLNNHLFMNTSEN